MEVFLRHCTGVMTVTSDEPDPKNKHVIPKQKQNALTEYDIMSTNTKNTKTTDMRTARSET